MHLFYAGKRGSYSCYRIPNIVIMVGLTAGGQQIIHAIFTPTALGKAEVLIACCTDSVSPPAGFSAVSHVKGLSVAYTVQPYPPATPLPPQPPLALSSSHLATGKSGDQAPVLNTDAMVGVRVSANSVSQANRPHQGRPVTADFGHVGIGETKSLLLSICNDSPVAASVNLWLDTFQAGVVSSAKAAAARTQPHAMASAGSLMPGSSTGQKSYLTGLSSPYGMSASWAQAHSPALPLGSTAGAGGQVEGHKHHARKAGRGGTKHDSRQTLVSPRPTATVALKVECRSLRHGHSGKLWLHAPWTVARAHVHDEYPASTAHLWNMVVTTTFPLR